MKFLKQWIALAAIAVMATACTLDEASIGSTAGGGGARVTVPADAETARVTRIIDGDTIEVDIDGVGYRVRYVGVNTPERDESCYQDAKDANTRLVQNKTVQMARDESNTDRYGRLLRLIYVDGVFVNQQLVQDGWAESVVYRPDTRYADEFSNLEQQAARTNRGCHPTGIFDDGSSTR